MTFHHPHSQLRARRTRARGALTALSIAVALIAAVPSFGIASLATEDRIDEVPVTVRGEQTAFTVLRDARLPEQWYYVPDQPRLYERILDGQTLPELAIIRYQSKNPENPQELIEGGLLQFSAKLSVPAEALDQLRSAIQQRHPEITKPIRVAALPMKAAAVRIYASDDGKMIGSTPDGTGVAPTFATQKMAFSIPLTRLGSDVYDTLVNDTGGGVGVAVEWTYTGLSPALGYKLEVDWSRMHEYLAKNQKFAAEVGWVGVFGAKAEGDLTRIRETLETNKLINIEVITGSGFTMEDADKVIQPFLKRINDEMLKQLAPPEKIEPPKAGEAKAGKIEAIKKFFGSGSYTVATKDIKEVKKGKETIVFTLREQQEQKTVSAGFIGLGGYPEEVKQQLTTVVPEGPWRSAYFLLPSIADAKDLGIAQVDLEVRLKHESGVDRPQVVKFVPGTGWQDRDGKPRTVVTFPLMSLGLTDEQIQELEFETLAAITIGGDVLELREKHAVFNGETAINTPMKDVQVVSVDGSFLTWSRVFPDSQLIFVNVGLEAGERRVSKRLRPRNVDGQWMEPLPVYWLVDRSVDSVKADIRFGLSSGEMVSWPHSGRDLAEATGSLEVTLVDGHWQAR